MVTLLRVRYVFFSVCLDGGGGYIVNILNIYPCPVSEGPKKSHLGGVGPKQPCHSLLVALPS